MLNLVNSEDQLPAHGTDPAKAKLYAEAQRQLRALHQQQQPGLQHLLAIIQFRRDDASKQALAPTGTEHQRGQAYATQALVEELHAILTAPANTEN